MIRNVVIGLLAVAVIATGYWGFQERDQKQTLMLSTENHYQRAFHELAFHIDQIEHQIGATLAMNTRRQLTPALAEVWRITSLAQEELGQLPLNSLELGNTEEFLYKLGKFSYRTSIRDLDKEPLTDKEYKTLEQLYGYAKDIRNEVRKSQAYLLSNNERWVNIEKEMAAQEEQMDNVLVNNFSVMNKSVEGFSEVDWGAGMAAMDDLNGELKKALEDGEEVSEQEAERLARKYLGVNENASVHVSETGDGLEYPAYTIVVDDPEHETNYFMDMSVFGGHPIWFLQNREVEEPKISLNEASEKAKQYLEERGKESMQLIESKQYDSIGVFTFAYLEDNVRVYPDAINIEVALDDGDVVSYEAKNYLINHKDRDLPKPKLTMEEAQKKVNPKVKVMENHLAVIENDLGEEVLCYEFIGVIKDDTYQIFINAEDGQEEQVERLEHSEPIYNFS
ncbi:germination protein YpeB [Halalkalibacter urbisdiaboli]|uniref:germination protein YpeB n=1 Tax=Halalkalibacter urbisdiaboli TaxID=1960589 RepID=UPI000B4522AC|nr:germination protein YpeB [Halalkalibacter urbisdiaboli]